MMKPTIALITIVTNDVSRLVSFYRDVLGFTVKQDLEIYVEFESEGVRFAICARSVMKQATNHSSYEKETTGQSFELAFPVEAPEAVDTTFEQIVAAGAIPIHPPADMPWGQRAAFFADPDGHIHELFADLPAK
jgi:lactoylglutathione lyase